MEHEVCAPLTDRTLQLAAPIRAKPGGLHFYRPCPPPIRDDEYS